MTIQAFLILPAHEHLGLGSLEAFLAQHLVTLFAVFALVALSQFAQAIALRRIA